MSLDANRGWVRHWVKLDRAAVIDSLRGDERWAEWCLRDGARDWRHLAQWSGEIRGLRMAVMLDEPWVTEETP